MKTLICQEEIEKNIKINKSKVPCECEYCHKKFYIKATEFRRILNDPSYSNHGKYCSRQCKDRAKTQRGNVLTKCLSCGKEFYKKLSEIKKHPNSFCSCSCSATYHNAHRTTGYRRSKLEIYLEEKLTILYPNLEILYNDKEAIHSELDIYIPSLKLAFELNGIFHYEPIHGDKKLDQIQNNDERKFQACIENNIELCIIDSSGLKYFKEKNVKKYLDITRKIISNKLKSNLSF